jgi:putative endonuclease
VRGGWIYIMTNRPNGTLNIGVTNDIARRAREHRTGIGSQFTSRYRLTSLVYVERHENILIDPTRKEHEGLAARLEGQADQPLQPEWRDLYSDLL